MTQKIIIVGNGPAGMSAAGAARLANRTAEITVIDTKDYDTYHPCAMPFVIGGYLPSIDTIIENLNYEMMKVALYKNSFVENIDIKSKKVFFKSKNEEQMLEYDKLILCTGSKAFIPPIPGKDLENVFSLKFAEDAEAIHKAVSDDKVKKIVVVGGSAIGIEVASEISHLGKEVTIIEMLPQLMPFKISKNYAEIVEKNLTELGITIKTNMMVKQIIGDKKVKQIKYGNQDFEETIDADVIVLATGVRPNAELAMKIGLKVHEKFKAIVVNEKMETSVEDIYAAGDCVTTYNIVTNQTGLALLAGPGVRQGRIAGINAAGGNESYPGSVNSFIVSSRNFYVGIAGINEDQAQELNIDVVTAKLSAPIRPHYMPTTKEITIKLIAKADDGKILGVEVIGEENIDVNVNYVAMALQTGLTVYNIMDIDFCYAPAVSETIYPLVKVADAIIRKIERKKAKNS
ncbi:MAG: FAD-dependent oxidoreductase [Candidatus Heimdallarchaeota archaeon]|nr:FAD-dependent oxidoreductase [Candidatus Heimdallarchaeota archaeon]